MTATGTQAAHGDYLPQLDGLRAWACGAVMVSHFFPAYAYPVTGWLALGATGVRLFFVLSGFLITGILLRSRDHIARGEARGAALLGAFYARRFLRIFPLFYGVILVLWVMDYGHMRAALFWHLTYLMNFWRVTAGVNFLNHFWSLAVEEHFYLVWPLLILCTPRRALAPVIITCAATAQIYRFAAWHLGADIAHLNIITFANLDTLALGGLLALYAHQPGRYPGRAQRLAGGGLLAGGLGTAALMAGTALGLLSHTQRAVFLSLTEGLLFCGIIALGARGALPGARWWLTPGIYVGKISYGLYVLHPLVWEGLEHLETHAGLPLPGVWWLRMPLFFAAALVAAALSWHAFELPLNRLKRHVPYVRKEAKRHG